MVDTEENGPAVAVAHPADLGAPSRTKLFGRSGVLLAMALGALAIVSTCWRTNYAPSQTSENLGKAQANREPLVYTTDEALLAHDNSVNSLDALRSVLSKAEWPTPPGEFETSAEYQARLAHFDKPIGEYGRTTPFVVIVPAVTQYDADAGTLSLQTSPGGAAASPSVVLESNAANGGTYVGENAFGVKAAVTQTVTTQTILIPIAPLKGPAGCDFLNGKDGQQNAALLVDKTAFTDWACGRFRYIDSSSIENVSSYEIHVDKTRAKAISSGDLKFAYVISFDLQKPQSPLIGPMDYENTQPTINNPRKFRVTGMTLIARLRRVVIYTANGSVILRKSYK